MKHFDPGPLVWKAPVLKALPRWVLYACAFGLLCFTLLIGYAIIDVIRPMRNKSSDPVFWICIGSVTVFGLLGLWTLYCAVNYRILLGTLFHRNGIFLGEGERRRFINYRDLETFRIVVARPPDATDKAVNIARAAVSVVALNPAGIGRALATAVVEPDYSEIFVKPHDGDLITIPLTRAQHDLLAPLVEG